MTALRYMDPNPWSLLEEMSRVQQSFNRVFDGGAAQSRWPRVNGVETERSDIMSSEKEIRTVDRVPAVDIWEDAEATTIEASLPGVARDAAKIEVADGILTIEGRTVRGPETGADQFEVLYKRRFALDDTIDVTAITAKASNGVLTVKLPRRAELKPRTVAITAD